MSIIFYPLTALTTASTAMPKLHYMQLVALRHRTHTPPHALTTNKFFVNIVK